jgi:hypothetical protein
MDRESLNLSEFVALSWRDAYGLTPGPYGCTIKEHNNANTLDMGDDRSER